LIVVQFRLCEDYLQNPRGAIKLAKFILYICCEVRKTIWSLHWRHKDLYGVRNGKRKKPSKHVGKRKQAEGRKEGV
jgi:hypothetical protein